MAKKILFSFDMEWKNADTGAEQVGIKQSESDEKEEKKKHEQTKLKYFALRVRKW